MELNAFVQLVSEFRREGDSEEEILEAFRVFDPQFTGVVSVTQFAGVVSVTQFNFVVSVTQFTGVVSVTQFNGVVSDPQFNGVVSVTQFTGVVSVTQFRQVMMNYGERLSENDVDDLISLADVDRKGDIRYMGDVCRPLGYRMPLLYR